MEAHRDFGGAELADAMLKFGGGEECSERFESYSDIFHFIFVYNLVIQ